MIYELIHNSYETGPVPKYFIKCIVVPIPKKTTVKTCEQYRTLSIAYVKKPYPYCVKNNRIHNRGFAN